MDRAACRTRPEWFIHSHAACASAAAAVHMCLACPVLEQCTGYAQQHRWQGVVIAAWIAPSRTDARYRAPSRRARAAAQRAGRLAPG